MRGRSPEYARVLGERYPVLIALHTDHAPPDRFDAFVRPLIDESRRRRLRGEEPLFQSHMFDGSTLPLAENLLIAKAQAQGLPITVEAYPYGTGSTVLAAAFFSDPEFEARNGLGYDLVQRVTDGHRFRDRKELLAAQAEPSTLVLWHVLDIENNQHHRDLLDISVLYPGGAIASDAMPWTLSDGSAYTGDAWPLPDDATSHPRSAGCFTRFIREWVRERKKLSLLEGVRKCALIRRRSFPAARPRCAPREGCRRARMPTLSCSISRL